MNKRIALVLIAKECFETYAKVTILFEDGFSLISVIRNKNWERVGMKLI